MFLLFIERGVLSFNGLNPKSRLSLHQASTHPSVYLFAKWTPTMWAASDWGLNPAQCPSFNHFLCNSLNISPLKHFFQPSLLIQNDAVRLIFILIKSPLSPSSSCSSFTGCRWLFVEKLKTWCRCKTSHSHSSRPRLYASAAASHLALLSLVIFPHGHRSSSCWVPEDGMSFPL